MKRKDNIMVWRVFSFLCIFIIHLAHSLNAQGKIRVITDFGYTAVYFFIAISGYLAFAGYKDGTRAVDYWKRRAIRILPLYYSVILLSRIRSFSEMFLRTDMDWDGSDISFFYQI